MAKTNAALLLIESPDQERVRADLAEFFGPNAGRYLAKYEKMRAKGFGPGKAFLSWNWGVFCLDFTWFFYRKQYLLGVFLLAVPLAMGFLLKSGGGPGIGIALTMFADCAYVREGLRSVAKADGLGLRGAERTAYLEKRGGVSKLAGGMALAVWLVIVGLVLLGLAVRLAGRAKGM